MTTCRFLKYRLFIPILLLFTASLTSFSSVPCRAYEMLLGTDEVGTFSYFAGRTICRAVTKYGADVSCKAVVAPDHTHNLTNLQGGSLDLALVNSKLLQDALTHSGLFKYMDIKYDNLRYLMPLYKVPISLLVRQDSKIKTVEDLKGKRVNGGEPLSLQDLIFSDVMTAMGWQISDFSLYQNLPAASAQDFIAFNNGTVQAMLHIGVHPDTNIKRQMSESRGTVVGLSGGVISKLVDAKKGYSRCVIPAETYSEISGNLETMAIESLLITNEDMDDSMVKTLLDALVSAKIQLNQAHPCLLGTDIKKNSVEGSDISPHAAAVTYFQQ